MLADLLSESLEADCEESGENERTADVIVERSTSDAIGGDTGRHVILSIC